MQSQGITAAQVNQQLRQINLNAPAAAPRSPAPSSRCACSATRRGLCAVADADRASRRPHGAARRLARSRQQQRAALDRQDRRQAGRQLRHLSAPRARPTSPSTTKRWEELRKIEKANPRIKFTEIYNSVDYTKSSTSSMLALVEGAVLAVIVVFLFLRDWRATLISPSPSRCRRSRPSGSWT
jgi:multidrug efflux pump subunit AcrB